MSRHLLVCPACATFRPQSMRSEHGKAESTGKLLTVSLEEVMTLMRGVNG